MIDPHEKSDRLAAAVPHSPLPRAMGWLPALLGLIATLAVLFTLDHPGLTADEPLDVGPGRQYWKLLGQTGGRFLTPEVIEATYRTNKEHPPLGRWLLGAASLAFEPVEAAVRGPDPTGLYVRSGRVAPALAFGLLVCLVARWSQRRDGDLSAAGAGLSLLLMPRLFAHAHLGALDTFVATTWTAAYLSALRLAERPSWRSTLLCGLATGLALLTKIHGWLLFPMVAAALGWKRPGWTTVARLAMAGGLAVVLFFAAWPWLWADPWGRFLAFFRTGIDRVPIRVLYLGVVQADVDVPWHYPWLYFGATIPAGILLLFGIGAWCGRARGGVPAQTSALLVPIVGWLLLFSTRVPVYDGERLYLTVFPFAAILAGRGLAWVYQCARGRWSRVLLLGCGLGQAMGIVITHPFELSYYNALVGGLRGAERLGLELTYWGDTVDDGLLGTLVATAGQGDSVARVPTVSPSQGALSTTLAMAKRDLVMHDQESWPVSRWLVVDRREAYWPKGLSRHLQATAPIAVQRRQGVWLSGIWPGPVPDRPESN